MKTHYSFLVLAAAVVAMVMPVRAQEKLSGTAIGTELSVDYSDGQASTTVNTFAMAHDGDLNTYFASYERNYTWTGLDLGVQYVISRVGWAPRNDGLGEGRVVLGMFQGANSPDFMDAVPLYLITGRGTIGQMSYADVDCSRGFRYVRYVGPADARCNIAEVEFYGTAGAGNDSRLWQLTNLPTVCINTVNAQEPYDKENDIIANIIIISEQGTQVLEKTGTTRLRGNASLQFDKKPYRIKFDKKQSVLNAPAKAKKWTLINNYGDKTLMRNIVAFEASRRAGMSYTPFCQAVDVVFNGEYKGNYQFCDQVEVNDNRVPVTEMLPTDTEGEALTGGYFIEVDGYADQEISWFRSSRGVPVTIKSPDEDEIVQVQKDYITNYFNHMEDLAYSAATGSEETYADIIDLPSFLRLFLVGEFSGNTDTYWSTYIYKERSDPRLYFGPVWDFDIAFDNDSRTYPVNNKSNYVYLSGGSSAGTMTALVMHILNRTEVETQLKALWQTMRDKRNFTPESMCAYIDSIAQDMDASQRLNFTRWPILNQYVHMNPVVYGTYAEHINALKQYATRRIEWLDRKLDYTPSTGIADVDTDSPIAISVQPDGTITLLGSSAPYAVYDLAGSLCATGSADAPARLSAHGVYIVAIGTHAYKVVY
ncbi:MAG: CotH kinase family protein [Paludibacteraceae bacterium]